MPKLIMMIGLPGSGKSTTAKMLAEQENAIILSSDELRVKLFGDINVQDKNNVLFAELYKRVHKYTKKEGKSVIIDATNINSKRRMNALKNFPECEKICYYMDVPPWDCLERDRIRGIKEGRSVGFDVIFNMYRGMQIPMYFEGWDEIRLSEPVINSHVGLADIEMVYRAEPFLYKEIMKSGPLYSQLYKIEELPHDNPHHTFSVSRHTYHVYLNVLNMYREGKINKNELKMWILTALFHDVGKAYTKEFLDGKRYATFYGHENVSAQIVLNFLRSIGETNTFALNVAQFVQLHMKLLNLKDEKALVKFEKMISTEWFNRLKLFAEADTNAK